MRRRIALMLALTVAPQSALPSQVAQTGFLDRSVTVNGVAHHYEVYVPFDYSPTKKWPVIMFLHGAGERGSDGLLQTTAGLGNAVRRKPSAYPAIIIFPQALNDSTWVGRFGDAAMAALDKTLKEFSTDPDRVYLTGLSMGGLGTWHLAYRYPERFAAIAPICGWIIAPPGHLQQYGSALPNEGDPLTTVARRIGNLPTWIFHGEVDQSVPVESSRAAAGALQRAGGNVRYTEFLGMDHNVWDAAYASPQFLDWLFAQRRQPKR